MGDSYHVGIKNMLDYDTHALCLVVVTTTMQRLWIPYCFEIRLRYNYSGIQWNYVESKWNGKVGWNYESQL